MPPQLQVFEYCSARLDQSPAALKFIKLNKNHVEDRSQNSLIVGTYQIPENYAVGSNTRLGGLYLVNGDDLQVKYKNVDHLDGIFRFEHGNNNGRVIAASTSGKLAIFSLANDEDNSNIRLDANITVTDSMLLDCSALDGQAICTDSMGKLFLVDIEIQSVLSSLTAHQMQNYWTTAVNGIKQECQIWSCAWLGPKVCATGAEDACLYIWDLRSPPSFQPQQQNKKTHSAGITKIIHANEFGEYSILTGSYDDYFRLFDIRQLQSKISEIKLSGGVWDANRVGKQCFVLACMYGGWSLVRLCPDSSLCLIHCQPHNGHLLYGVDAQPMRTCNQQQEENDGHHQCYMFASCTFDDNHLRLERCTLPEDITL